MTLYPQVFFKKYQMGTTIWSLLASGTLSGKYLDGILADSRANLPEWLRKKLTDHYTLNKVKKLKVISDTRLFSLPISPGVVCK